MGISKFDVGTCLYVSKIRRVSGNYMYIGIGISLKLAYFSMSLENILAWEQKVNKSKISQNHFCAFYVLNYVFRDLIKYGS